MLGSLWVRFLRVGVWEVPVWGQCRSVWGLPVGDTPLLTFLPMKTGEGLRDFHLLVSCCSVGVPLCHFSGQVSRGSGSPPLQRSALNASERTRQQPGSRFLLCALLS